MKPFKNITSALLLTATIQFGFLQLASAGYESCDEQVYKCSTSYERQCGNEQVCHTVPGQRECRTTAPERQCNTVPGREECHIVPGNRECHQVQDCRDASPVCHTEQQCGTNALGEPICKDRQVCESGGQNCSSREVCSGSDSQQQCSTGPSTQECGLVPGHEECYDTGSRQECSNEYRCSDQPKETCGYETVHKQCWVADPTPTPPYTPAPNPPAPPYHPPVDEPPYNPPAPPYYPPVDDEPPYVPAPPHNPPAPPIVVPAPDEPTTPPAPPIVVPAPDEPADPTVPGDIGTISVTDLNLDVKNNKIVSVSLKDKGQSPTYQTRYYIAINDQKDVRVVNQFARGNGSDKKQTIMLNSELPQNQSYAVAIKVVRTGGVLVQDVTFVVSKKVIKPKN